MSTRVAFTSLLLLLLPVALVQADTVPSSNFNAYYNCPNREVAENAYLSSCPATTRSSYPLIGTSVIAGYNNAPNSYKLNAYGVNLGCYYQHDEALVECHYLGGGGVPMTASGENPSECSDAPTSQPQPSPGLDYRRRSTPAISKRAGVSKFNCPWDSNNADYYTIVGQTLDGYRATNLNQNYDKYYYCRIHVPGSNTVCSYSHTEADGIVADVNNNAYCPKTLCQAIDGDGNTVQRRRVFERETAFDSRQVNTRALRRKLGALAV